MNLDTATLNPSNHARKQGGLARTWQICRAFTQASLLETLRRKDLYVLVVLTALMVFGSYSFTFFGVSGLEIFVKDMAFTAVGIFSTIVGVLVAARQVPEELSRRTIYPLLARPITRWQLLLGKFVAAWVTCIVCFLMLALVARLVLLATGIPVQPIFWQYLLLKCVGFGWLCGFTMCLSLLMSQGAAVTIALLLCSGSAVITRAFVMFYDPTSGINPLINAGYALAPNYALFDLTKKVVYDWKPISASPILFLLAYGLPISLFWLSLGWMRFRKQAV